MAKPVADSRYKTTGLKKPKLRFLFFLVHVMSPGFPLRLVPVASRPQSRRQHHHPEGLCGASGVNAISSLDMTDPGGSILQ